MEIRAFSCFFRSCYKELIGWLVKGRAGLALKICVQPESCLPRRWPCGRRILEQICHRGKNCWAFSLDLWWEYMSFRGSQRALQRSCLLTGLCWGSEASGCCLLWAPLFICLQRVFEILLNEVLCKCIFLNPYSLMWIERKFCVPAFAELVSHWGIWSCFK